MVLKGYNVDPIGAPYGSVHGAESSHHTLSPHFLNPLALSHSFIKKKKNMFVMGRLFQKIIIIVVKVIRQIFCLSHSINQIFLLPVNQESSSSLPIFVRGNFSCSATWLAPVNSGVSK